MQIPYKLHQFCHVLSKYVVGLWTQYLGITFMMTSEVSIRSLKSDKYSLQYCIQVLKDDSYLTKKLYINHELVEIKLLS